MRTSIPSDLADGAATGGRLQKSIFAPFALLRRLKLEKVSGSCRKNRRGAAVVEFAVVAPIFFLLVFGMIEYGRMVMVQQILTNASREGARVAILDGMTSTDVTTTVDNYLNNSGIVGANVSVATNPPVAPDYAESMTIAVDIPFSQVSWLPTPIYLQGRQLTATSTMRREAIN
jgi:Flp pilus assembly protein TadG